MSLTVKEVFDKECANLKIDTRLAKRIADYRMSFEMRNENHIAFFGGNLTGVNPVRFTIEDKDKWFNDILNIGEYQLADQLASLPSVDKTRKVTSDTMNISFVWLLYKFQNSTLSVKVKHQAMIDVCLIMLFKFLTSRLWVHFKYPADITIAQATYAQLNYKFALKQYGSWIKVLIARAEDIISKNSIHYKTIQTLNEDSWGYLLSDTQSRIRDMLKNIYNVHLTVRSDNRRISSSSSTIELDGDQLLKDITNSLKSYTRYIHSVIPTKDSLIKQELVQVIEKMMRTMSPRMFKNSLEWISNNYQQRGSDNIDKAVDSLLLYSLNYLQLNRSQLRSTTDIASMLGKLKGTYMSSRNTDDLLTETKVLFENIVTKATGSKHPNIVASVRTGLMLYFMARTLAKNYYEKSII